MNPSIALDFPIVSEIEAIAAQSDPVIRNLWITWSYYRLNRAMRTVTGDTSLSWCGFATWASKTAGAFIRQDEVPGLIEEWIGHSTNNTEAAPVLLAHALGIHSEDPSHTLTGGLSVRSFLHEAIDGVSDAIARGNQDVFRHIAPPFAALLSLWASFGGGVPETEKQGFLNSLRDREDADPNQYLFQAFSAMFVAAESADPLKRAQAMLQANALIGCAEQTRVQPYIETSMNAPIADMFTERVAGHLIQRFSDLIARGMHDLLKPLANSLELGFHEVCTKWMMRLDVPGQALRLGLDVPPLEDGQMYPELLVNLDAPQLTTLLEQLRALQAEGSGAKDWSSYEQRMRYIAVLFRSRQQSAALWDRPFTEDQISELTAGRLPSGPL